MYLGDAGPAEIDFRAVPAYRPVVDNASFIRETRYPGMSGLGGASGSSIVGLVTQARSLASSIQSAAAGVAQAVMQAKSQYSGVDASQLDALVAQAQQAASSVNTIMASTTPAGNTIDGVGSFWSSSPNTQGIYNDRDFSFMQSILTKLQSLQADYSGPINQWKQQAQGILASIAAGQAQQQAESAVSKALTQAQLYASSGNFATALATLSAPNVVSAAQSIGRDAELSAAVSSLNAQANAASSNAANIQAQLAKCQAAGGFWSGNSCDMSQVNQATAIAQQAAAQQAQASAVTLQSQNALAVQQAQFQAQQAQLQAQNEAASQARADALAAQQAQWAHQDSLAQLQFQQQSAAQQAQQVPQLLQSLAPLFSTNPQVAMMLFQSLVGGGGGIAGGIPGGYLDASGGQGPSNTPGFSVDSSKFASGYGSESF